MKRKLRRILKRILRYVRLFLIVMTVLIGLLIGTALIPNDLIKDNMKRSAEFLCEKNSIIKLNDKINANTINRYADSIILSVSYHMQSDDKLKSAMLAEYYENPKKNENTNLYDTLFKNKPANQQCTRYWHGSAAVVRFLHMFLDIKGIYITNGVLLSLLAAALFAILMHGKVYSGAAGYILAMIASGVWNVPFSLENTWTFIIMFAFSIAASHMAMKDRWKNMGALFMVSGITTNYFDFLTTEPVTMLMPLLLVLSIKWKKKKPNGKDDLLTASSCGMLWLTGYSGTWGTKWLLASAILGENAMPYENPLAVNMGISESMSFIENIFFAIVNNVGCMFPMNRGFGGIIFTVIFGTALVYVCFVYHKKKAEAVKIQLYTVISAIPYIKYVFQNSESAINYLFTYRTQAATIFGLTLAVIELVDWKWLLRSFRKKRRK